MKRNSILALLLSLAMLAAPLTAAQAALPEADLTILETAPTESPIPEADLSPLPDEPSIPEEPPVPTESPAPDQSPLPEESPAPTESPLPEESPIPDEIPEPDQAPGLPPPVPAVNMTEVAPFLPPFSLPAAGFSRRSLPPGPDVQGLSLEKSVGTPQGDRYPITLEAWSSGELSVITKNLPTDVVLVLDQSGSMADPMTYSPVYDLDTSKTYYILRDGAYTPVYRSIFGGWYCGLFDYVTPKTSPTSEGTQFFVQLSRRDCLQSVLTTFLQSVADSARTDQLDHRVAVVGFADGPYDFSNTVLLSTDQPVPYNSAKDADYQDALVPANVAQAVNPRLTAAVSRLATEGSTHPEYGLELAEEILRCTKTPNPQNRNRVVILLTDGYPSRDYAGGFGYTAADSAIAQSKTIKTTYGATVYTVGLFSAANPAASIDDGYSYGGQTPAKTAVAANRFMHLVSSNYPQASSMNLPDTRPDASGSYYLSAGEEAALEDIFAQIGDQIQTPVSHVDLTATAVLRDVLSPSFVFPSGTTAEDILVSRVPYAGSGTWGAPVPYPCTVTVEGSTVSVSGFDYSASENAVFDEPGPSPTYGGNKLVVTLFAQRASFGGNGVPTNNAPGQTSGIYAEGALMEPFPVPTVDLPIRLTVAAQDASIYLGSQPDFGALLDRTKSDLPDGTNNAYVTLVYALYQGETMVASCTVHPGESMTDWSSPATFTPKTCTNYTLSCTVTPAQTGTVPVYEAPPAAATLHVLTPALAVTPHDAWADYGALVPLSSCLTVRSSDTWTDAESHVAFPAPSGTPPTVASLSPLLRQTSGDGTLTGGTYTSGTTDGSFSVSQVSCTVGGVPYTFPVPEALFRIYVNHFTLTITKTLVGGNAGQSFLFSVSDGVNRFPLVLPQESFAGGSTAQVSLEGLLCGKSYTVTENGRWSWRYTQSAPLETVITAAHTPAYSLQAPAALSRDCALSNTLTSPAWLSGECLLSNRYQKSAVLKGGRDL